MRLIAYKKLKDPKNKISALVKSRHQIKSELYLQQEASTRMKD